MTNVNGIKSCKKSEDLKKIEKGDYMTHLKGKELVLVVSRTNKTKATPIPVNIDYIKNPITKVIVVNSKPSRRGKL